MTETFNKVILTGDQVEIVPLTSDELLRLENHRQESEAAKAAEAKVAADKLSAKAKLEALGLTIDDLAALGL
jgi:hypothetical protein